MRSRLAVMLALTLISTGCASAPAISNSAICEKLEPIATRHAAALVADGGPRSRATGRQLISGLDAGCGVRS